VAWNTEETKRRLKEAATEEFAAHGLAGTTVDRIARRAGVNKERLYNYFGDKERLFATIVADELARIAGAVPMPAAGRVDVGDFAGRVFDYHAEHPQLARLLHWEGLAYDGAVPDEEVRAHYYRQKVDAFAAAQHKGVVDDDIEAAHLAFLVIALAAWWFAVPQVVRMLTGGPGDTSGERSSQRRAVVTAARRLAGEKPDIDLTD
jgi:AcrR family transcriptional regulator